MKYNKLLITFFIFCTITQTGKTQRVYEQSESLTLEERLQYGGKYLKTYSNTMNFGYLFMLVGSGVSIGGAVNNANLVSKGKEPNVNIVYVGAGIAGLGFIIQMIASAHIGRAGRYLQGGKIAIPLNRDVNRENRGTKKGIGHQERKIQLKLPNPTN
ncbi:MAG: hypothetical protein LCH44_10540 [Bacteroidetes bacterium]|nr:hypothetical protein [Bacteroidota bacterium]